MKLKKSEFDEVEIRRESASLKMRVLQVLRAFHFGVDVLRRSPWPMGGILLF